MPRRIFTLVTLVTVLAISYSAAAAGPVSLRASAAAAPTWRDKVDPWVLETGAKGETEFLVFLAEQADVRAAANFATKTERGEFVYRTLSAQAERTQGPLRQRLQLLGVAYRPFWVANMIWVRAGLGVVQALAERADVAHIYANPTVRLDEAALSAGAQAQTSAPDAVEWNITKVNAPQVWTAGVTGQGAVIGGQDTGYRWTHSALKNKYRGWDGAAADHNYNWHDAIHTTGSSCGSDSLVPCDDYGHGTHTMGTMVGDDGGTNQVGMAPGAKWIGCRNMDQGNGTPATYSECYQWFIAPTDLNDQNPKPELGPDVINNSWGCPTSEGCTDPNVLLTVVQNVTAAGIVTVHSAGNDGSTCGTISTPGAIYGDSFTVGATTNTANDDIASYSSRGPVTVDGSNRMKPNISAPGSGVRSSYNSGDSAYSSMSGTSMAGPHVAGLVALLISANPGLRGNVGAIRSMIEQSAVRRTTTQGCGGDTSTAVPNNVYGWGRIDAKAAYDAAVACTPPVVHDLTIQKLSEAEIELSWAAQVDASSYNVLWGPVPYFTPTAKCTVGSCLTLAGTSLTQAISGGTGSNYSYTVQTRWACGALQLTPSNRVGAFQFGLTAGTP